MTSIPGISQISQFIKGFSNRIDTPFGQVASLHCDGYFTGRPVQQIENLINQFIRPYMGGDSFSDTYNGGNFSKNLHHASESIILQCVQASSSTHSVYPCGDGELQAYQQLSRLLQLGALSRRAKMMGAAEDLPVVYVSSIETYQNLLPWFVSGCKVIGVDIDEQGNLKPQSLAKAFAQNANSKYQIISVSTHSTITLQKVNMERTASAIVFMKEQFQKKFQGVPHAFFFTVMDATYLCARAGLQLGDYGFVDFFIVNPGVFIGGLEASSIIIAQKNSVLKLNNLDIGVEEESLLLDVGQSTKNQIPFYRSALCFQLIRALVPSDVVAKEKENAKFLIAAVKKFNAENASKRIQINLSGNQKTEYDFAAFVMTINVNDSIVFDNSNRPMLDPMYVGQLLNDLFGIQTSFRRACVIPKGLKLIQVPNSFIPKFESYGFTDVYPGSIIFSLDFTLQKDDLVYFVECLQVIAEYGTELVQYYDHRTDQRIPIDYHLPDYQLNLAHLYFNQNQGDTYKTRQERFADQLEEAKQIFKKSSSYFSLKSAWIAEKSSVHPKKHEMFTQKKKQRTSILGKSINIDAKTQFLNEAELAHIKQAFSQKVLTTNNDAYIKHEDQSIASPKHVRQNSTDSEGTSQHSDGSKERELKENNMVSLIMQMLKTEKENQENQNYQRKQASMMIDIYNTDLSQRERRAKNLQNIFNFYCDLKEGGDGKRAVPPSQSQKQHDNQDSKDLQVAQAAAAKERLVVKFMSMNKFLQFCDDFNLINDDLDPKFLSQLFLKSCQNMKDMSFFEFSGTIEQIALIRFEKQPSCVTSFDQIEVFYQWICIDDPIKLKEKMKKEEVTNITNQLHEQYAQISANNSAGGSLNQRQKKNNSVSINHMTQNGSGSQNITSNNNNNLSTLNSSTVTGSKSILEWGEKDSLAGANSIFNFDFSPRKMFLGSIGINDPINSLNLATNQSTSTHNRKTNQGNDSTMRNSLLDLITQSGSYLKTSTNKGGNKPSNELKFNTQNAQTDQITSNQRDLQSSMDNQTLNQRENLHLANNYNNSASESTLLNLQKGNNPSPELLGNNKYNAEAQQQEMMDRVKQINMEEKYQQNQMYKNIVKKHLF